MSERTVITTIEVTSILKNVPEDCAIDKKGSADGIKKAIKHFLNVDDVVVTNVQEFVMGDEE